jgi:hypothetical protein
LRLNLPRRTQVDWVLMQSQMPPIGLLVARAREQLVKGVSLSGMGDLIGMRDDRPADTGPRSDAGIFITPEIAFPGLTPTKEALAELLRDLDIDEVLFSAARINLALTEQLHVAVSRSKWELEKGMAVDLARFS